MKSTQKYPLKAIFFTAILLSAPLSHAYAYVTPPLTRCNIEVGDAHISKNLLLFQGIIAVKVNARSKCDKPMHNLVLTVEIYKEGLLVDHRVAVKKVKIQGLVEQNRVVKNQDTYVKCKTNKRTKYYGIAYGEALVKGERLKTLPVRSENIRPFQCGT